MSQGTILHLFHWDKKFAPPFRDMIHEHFADGRHKFVIYGNVEPDAMEVSADTVIYSRLLKNFFSLSRAMHRAEKIILHGLFNSNPIYILALQPWLLKKCCWVIWGGDLYAHEAKQKSWRWKKYESLREFVIKRLPLITTTVPGDYLLVEEWYGTKARFIQNLMYTSHIYRQVSPCNDKENDKLVIQIGNSADPSNNHKEIIDKLSALNANNFVVYVPLSYGNESYRDEVIAYGLSKLGDRFIPLTTFMSFEQYNNYLRGVDIVIFNHMRQQAMGNTIALLSLGKTVWLRSDVTPWSYFNELGLNVYDSKVQLHLCKMPRDKRQQNIELCTEIFSEKALLSAWKAIFNKPFSG
ncbi:MAG TPA: TDP-N-acetylfucosamine:lipid II N-acetylfucosaminyltransferase [Verrucomicrobiae bacterium]|nr:TDP-N-acetylfucosamine:lipid II N-acetylfucosaminyltransferase [Verrucomicrobiae bacterium]